MTVARRETAREPCPRCGSYAELRWHGRRELCERCIERVTHPIEKSPVTAGEVLRGTGQLLAAAGPKAALVTVLVHLPAAALLLWSDVGGAATMVYGMFVPILGTAMVIDLGLQHIDREERLSIGGAARVAVRTWLDLFLAGLVAGLIVLVFLLLLVVPGILRALSYALIYPLIVDGDATGTAALGLSRRRMKGHRGAAFLAYLVAWLAPVAGWVIFAAMQDAMPVLDFSSPIPPELRAVNALYALIDPLLAIPLTLVSVVLHAKLRNRAGARPRPPSP